VCGRAAGPPGLARAAVDAERTDRVPAPGGQRARFCPYEVLLAHFSYHRVTEQVIERMRRRWYAAQEEGVADSVLRPVRNVLSRVRLKVQAMGLDVVSLLDLGYQLLPLTRRRSRGPRQEQDEREEEE